jgi:hypothetical protein
MEIIYGSRLVGSMNPSRTGKPATQRGFDLVVVRIPLDFRFEAREVSNHWMLSELTVDLLVQRSGDEKWLLGSGSIVEMLRSANQSQDLQRNVDIRCSPRGLAQYEGFRDGGPVRLRCEVRGKICGLLKANGVDCLSNPMPVFGSMEIEWSKEDWTNALRSCGLSTSVVVEIPLPLVGEGVLDDGRKALLEAFDAFNLGGATAWKNSVDLIRPYLAEWKKKEPREVNEPKDGSDADHTWNLQNLRDALYKCCCFWIHGPASSCTREDALLALATFSSLLQVREGREGRNLP